MRSQDVRKVAHSVCVCFTFHLWLCSLVYPFLRYPPFHWWSPCQPSQRWRSPSRCLPMVPQRCLRLIRPQQVSPIFTAYWVSSLIIHTLVSVEVTRYTVKSALHATLSIVLLGVVLSVSRTQQMKRVLWQRRWSMKMDQTRRARCSSVLENLRIICPLLILMRKLLVLEMGVRFLLTWVWSPRLAMAVVYVLLEIAL